MNPAAAAAGELRREADVRRLEWAGHRPLPKAAYFMRENAKNERSTGPVEVTCTAEKDLIAADEREIMQLQRTAFPGASEFETQRWYHAPPAEDDLWFGVRQDGRLIGSIRFIHRRINTSAGPFTVGGIGNVCSDPEARGTRAGLICMKAAQKYIASGGRVDFGLLFCGQGVRDYYKWLGWKVIDNQLVCADADGNQIDTHAGENDFAMIYSGRRPIEDWPAGRIDLDGPDW